HFVADCVKAYCRSGRTASKIASLMATRTPDVDLSEALVAEFGENAAYVAELLTRYRTNPEAVDPDWREFFQERFGEAQPQPAAQRAEDPVAPAHAPSAPAAPAKAAAPASQPPQGEERAATPIRGAALKIAENMEASLGVPTAT